MSFSNLFERPVIYDHFYVAFGVVVKLRFYCKYKFFIVFCPNTVIECVVEVISLVIACYFLYVLIHSGMACLKWKTALTV